MQFDPSGYDIVSIEHIMFQIARKNMKNFLVIQYIESKRSTRASFAWKAMPIVKNPQVRMEFAFPFFFSPSIAKPKIYHSIFNLLSFSSPIEQNKKLYTEYKDANGQ